MYRIPKIQPSRDEMVEILKRHIKQIKQKEIIAIDDAIGRICGEITLSLRDLPNTPVSLMDGVAVRFDEMSPSKWVLGENYEFSGTSVAFDSEKFDTVIRIENIEKCENGEIKILVPPKKKGDLVGAVGSTLKKGEVVADEGERITPMTASVLKAAGHSTIAVYKKPNVVFIPTGDELVPSGGDLPKGKNTETNSTLISGSLSQIGCNVAVFPICKDDYDEIKSAVLRAINIADIVLVGAGSSKGEKDFCIDVLDELGKLEVTELGTAPGKHLSFAMIGAKPVMGIPGPPRGAIMCVGAYAKPACELLAFGKILPNMKFSAILGEDVDLSKNKGDIFQTMDIELSRGEIYAYPTKFKNLTRAQARHDSDYIFYGNHGKIYKKGDRIIIEKLFEYL